VFTGCSRLANKALGPFKTADFRFESFSIDPIGLPAGRCLFLPQSNRNGTLPRNDAMGHELSDTPNTDRGTKHGSNKL
jgi:hypothetical protein